MFAAWRWSLPQEAAARAATTRPARGSTRAARYAKDNILDLVAIGEAPAKNVKAKLKEIRDKSGSIERELSKATERRHAGTALLEDALDLLRDLQERYRRMSDAQRKLMNQAIFEKLYVTEDNITDAKVHPPFDQLMEARKEYESRRRQPTRQDHPRSHGRPQQGSQSRQPRRRCFWRRFE